MKSREDCEASFVLRTRAAFQASLGLARQAVLEPRPCEWHYVDGQLSALTGLGGGAETSSYCTIRSAHCPGFELQNAHEQEEEQIHQRAEWTERMKQQLEDRYRQQMLQQQQDEAARVQTKRDEQIRASQIEQALLPLLPESDRALVRKKVESAATDNPLGLALAALGLVCLLLLGLWALCCYRGAADLPIHKHFRKARERQRKAKKKAAKWAEAREDYKDLAVDEDVGDEDEDVEDEDD